MPSAGVPFDRLEVASLLKSPALARHVGHLGESTFNRLSLPLPALNQLCPQLRTLHCCIVSFACSEVGLTLPPGLRQLHVRLAGAELPHCLSAAVLPAIASLEQLHSLSLYPVSGTVSLAPLRQLPLLRTLHLHGLDSCSDSLLADLRALGQVKELELEMSGTNDDSWFSTLLAPLGQQQPPQWRSLSFSSWEPNDDVAPLLCTLPALERLEVRVRRLSVFTWLSALPALRHLHLVMWKFDDAPWAALLSVFTSGGLARLCSLKLSLGPCSRTDLSRLLPHLPQLERLELELLQRVASLAFLELPSLARSLTYLTVCDHYDQRLCGAHLSSLLGLQRLRDLRLLQWAKEAPNALTAEQRAPFEERPCRVLPELQVFEWMPLTSLFG